MAVIRKSFLSFSNDRFGLNTDYDFVKAWCVEFLNTDCTDNTDILLEDVKTGGFGSIVRKHKIIRDIRVIRVQ